MTVDLREYTAKTYSDFSGGLNQFASSYQIADNELVSCKNISLRDSGGVKSRNGNEQYSVGGVDTAPTRGMYRYTKIDGTKQMLQYSGILSGSPIVGSTNQVFADNDAGTFAAVGSILSSDGWLRFAQWRDIILMSTDRDGVRSYNDGETTEFQTVSLANNSSFGGDVAWLPAIATATTGGLLEDGSYSYRFTYDISHGDFLAETDPIFEYNPDGQIVFNQFIATFSSGSDTNKVRFLKGLLQLSVPGSVSKINVYRTPRLDGENLIPSAFDISRAYLYLGAISASVYNDAGINDIIFTDDGSISTDGSVPVEYGRLKTPPAGRFIAAHKDKVWLAHVKYTPSTSLPVKTDVIGEVIAPHRVFISRTNDAGIHEPMGFLSNSWLDVDPTDGEGITGMISYRNDFLVIFKPNSMWAITGTGENLATTRLRNLSPDIGCIAPSTIAVVDGGIIWVSNNGPYVFTGGRPEPLKAEQVRESIQSVSPRRRSNMVGIFHTKEREYWLALSEPEDEGYNRTILRYNVKTRSWTRDKMIFGISSFIEKKNTDEATELFGGATDDPALVLTFGATVLKLDTGTTEFKSNELDINFAWQTKFFDLDKPFMNKQFRAVLVQLVSPIDITMVARCSNGYDSDRAGENFAVERPSSGDLFWDTNAGDHGSPAGDWNNAAGTAGQNWAQTQPDSILVPLNANCQGERISLEFKAASTSVPVEIQKVTIFYKPKAGVR